MRSQSGALKELEERKAAVPDMVPGFRANPLTHAQWVRTITTYCSMEWVSGCLITTTQRLGRDWEGAHCCLTQFALIRPWVSVRIIQAFKAFEYIPYTALTSAARIKAENGEQEMELRPNGTLAIKKFDRNDERSIKEGQWQAASKLAVELARQYWPQGTIRAEALAKHHDVVTEIADSHSWQVAVAYDIRQREIMHRTPEHDISPFNEAILALVASQALTASIASMRNQQFIAQAQSHLTKRPAQTDFQVASTPQKRPRNVRRREQQPANQQQILFLGGEEDILLSPELAKPFVSHSQDEVQAHANLVTPVVTSTPVPYAEIKDTELAPASTGSDPRRVVTPLKANAIEEVLRKYNLLEDWCHIVHGVQYGFDVGARIPPSATHLFRKSQLIKTEPRIHFPVHSKGTGRRSLFQSILTTQARTTNRPIQDLPTWAGSQTVIQQLSDDPGHVVSQE
ncbi:hypothetical protein M422DRAFT_241195 [Sphaerobolus stellatus SS14]|nr:hypothetical protein M422DRAFT_241195 [Sphaerobolus stellatus SS14]